MLFERSDEGQLPGLGWLAGDVTRFDFSVLDDEVGQRLKVPHMGWNVVKPVEFETLYGKLKREPRFYFVHSYHVNCKDVGDILATSFLWL